MASLFNSDYSSYLSRDPLKRRDEEERDRSYSVFNSIDFEDYTIDPEDLDASILPLLKGGAEQEAPYMDEGTGSSKGLFESGNRVPSIVMPESGFTTKERTDKQYSTDLANLKSLNRNIDIFKYYGVEDSFYEAVENKGDAFGADTILTDVFDFLSIGNYSTAAIVEEMLNTGSPEKALRQAAIEISNSLGLADELGWESEVKRPTFGDILSGKRGDTELSVLKESPYVAAGAGFVLDMLLDPTTWFGFGLVKAARGLKHVDNMIGSPVLNATKMAVESPAGETFAKYFMPNSRIKGLSEGNNADEIVEIINSLNSKDPNFKPISVEDVKQGSKDFLAAQIRKDAAIAGGSEALRENIVQTAANLNEGELRIVGAFLDQPEVAKKVIGELKVDQNTKDVLLKGLDEWRDMYQKMFDAEESVGLLDKTMMRANYSKGTEPITEFSRRVVERMFRLRYGDTVGIKKYEQANTGVVTITDNGIMKSSYGKLYPDIESRLTDLKPTETNVAFMMANRGMESIRKVNSQKLLDTVLSDVRISVPIDEKVALDTTNELHQTLLSHGMRVFKAPALSTRKAARQAAGDEQVYYALPSAMVDNLEKMNKVISQPSEARGLFNKFKQVQGLWKAYALMSPGYHARNLYSNIFNNYIAGVSDPRAYAEAMLLQVEDTANIKNRAVRSTLEKYLGGHKTVDNYIFNLADGTKKTGRDLLDEINENGIAGGGLIHNEADLGLGRELMTTMQANSAKRPTTTQISEGLSDWGDRASRIARFTDNIYNAAVDAGADISRETAESQAQMLDQIASSWAWRNGKTPEDWYKSKINQIRAHALPIDGAPDSSLDFLWQRTPFESVKNVDTPEFKKAFEGAHAKYEDGTPIRFFHGTRSSQEVNEYGGLSAQRSRRGNAWGKALYVTEDISYRPMADADQTAIQIGPMDFAVSPKKGDKGYGVISSGYALEPQNNKMLADIVKIQNSAKSMKVDLSNPKKVDLVIARLKKRVKASEDKMQALLSKRSKFAGKGNEKAYDAASQAYFDHEKKHFALSEELASWEGYTRKIENTNNILKEFDNIGQTPGVFDGYVFAKNPFVLSVRGKKGEKIERFLSSEEASTFEDLIKKSIAKDLQKIDLRLDHKDLAESYASNGYRMTEQAATDLVDGKIGEALEEAAAKIGDDALETETAEQFFNRMSDGIARAYSVVRNKDLHPSIGSDYLNAALGDMGFDSLTHADKYMPVSGSVSRELEGLHHQVYALFDGRQFKSTRNRGTWNLSDEDMLNQMGPEGIQGAISFLPGGRADILTGGKADASTFIHEVGHLIRRNMLDSSDKDIIQRWMFGEKEYAKLYKEARRQAELAATNAPNAKIDVDALSSELMDRFAWTREGEELFAKAFEQFVMEGVEFKSMNSVVRGAFDHMKEQLGIVYDFSEGGSVGIKASDDARYVLQRALGRGVDSNPEQLDLPRAILESADLEKETILEKAHRLAADNSLTRFNRAFGERIENNARIAHYITMRTRDAGALESNGLLIKKKNGKVMSPEQAAASVRRYLFDYAELTDFERDVMKSVIPFYTWMRKNIPLQMEAMYRRPERYAPIAKMQNEIEGISSDWENTPTPDYFEEMNAIRMPFSSLPLGSEGTPMYLTLDLPYTDLNRLNMKDMIGSMTPFIRTWAEIYPEQGYSFFLEAPIEKYSDEPSFIEVYDRKFDTRMTEKQAYVLQTLLPPVGKAWRLAERAGEGKLPEQLLRETLGINFRSVDADAVWRADLYKKLAVSRDFRKKLEKKLSLLGGIEDTITPEDIKGLGL